MSEFISRRSALRKLTGSAAALSVAASMSHRLGAAENAVTATMKGRINHSVCKWCYPKIELEDLCKAAKEIGLQSIELLEIQDLPLLKKYDLTCAMVAGVPGAIPTGLNRLENHDKIVAWMEQSIPEIAKAG